MKEALESTLYIVRVSVLSWLRAAPDVALVRAVQRIWRFGATEGRTELPADQVRRGEALRVSGQNCRSVTDGELSHPSTLKARL